jgi:hypothetical protein
MIWLDQMDPDDLDGSEPPDRGYPGDQVERAIGETTHRGDAATRGGYDAGVRCP